MNELAWRGWDAHWKEMDDFIQQDNPGFSEGVSFIIGDQVGCTHADGMDWAEIGDTVYRDDHHGLRVRKAAS